MKKFFVGSIILSLFLLLSCKDNSLNNPVSPDMNVVQKSTDNLKTGEIPLDQILTVPGITETSYQLNGNISYREDVFPTNFSTSTSKPDINLELSIDGKLYDPDNSKKDIWDVVGNSDQEIYVSQDGIKLLNKSYLVSGRKDGLQLVCTFLVTTDRVSLSSAQLSYADHKAGLNGTDMSFPSNNSK